MRTVSSVQSPLTIERVFNNRSATVSTETTVESLSFKAFAENINWYVVSRKL